MDEVQTRISIATDLLLTACCQSIAPDSSLTEAQKDDLNRIYEDLDVLRKEVEGA